MSDPGVFWDPRLIAEARGLRSEHGENPEYDRALVEFIIRLTPLANHDEHTETVKRLIGMKAMDRLREAIVADVSEDLDLIGQMVEWHEELVAAFNAVPGVTPITNADLDVDAEDE